MVNVGRIPKVGVIRLIPEARYNSRGLLKPMGTSPPAESEASCRAKFDQPVTAAQPYHMALVQAPVDCGNCVKHEHWAVGQLEDALLRCRVF